MSFIPNCLDTLLRVDAARKGANGVQVVTMGQLAARLAGGFLQPIDPERLQEAVQPGFGKFRAWVVLDVIKSSSRNDEVPPPSARSTKSGARASTSRTSTDRRLAALSTLENEVLQ